MGRKDKAQRGKLARLHGVVRARDGGPIVLRTAVLEIGDDAPRKTPQLQRGFDLETIDGKRIAVTFTAPVETVPLVERKDRWEDLEDDEDAAPFREDAPAPHVKVLLRSFSLRDGDEVDLWGRTSYAMGSASFRAGATHEIASIELLACGKGEEGARHVAELEAKEEERRRPKETPRLPLRRVSVMDWILLATAGVGALSLPFLKPAARWDVHAITLLLLGSVLPSVFLGTKRLHFDRQNPTGTPLEKHRIGFGAVGLVFACTAAMFPFIDMSGDEEGPFNHAPIVAIGAGASLLLMAGYLFVITYRDTRIAQALLDAPPHALPWEHNKWGATEGTIATGSKRYEAKAAAFSLFEETFEEGSGGNPQAWNSDAGPFVLDADGKATVQVDATKAEWGTTVRWRIDGRRVTREHKKATREAALMPVGGRVLVAGRVKVRDGMAEIENTGKESLLLYSTAPGEQPRKILRTELVARAAIVILLVAFGVGLVVAAATGTLGAIHSGQGGD